MFMQASYSLALREVTRFLRQKNRVIGAMATPVLFWFLLALEWDDPWWHLGFGNEPIT